MKTSLSDDDFLAEVDEFLTSCDKPLQPAKGSDTNQETVPSPQTSIKTKLIHNSTWTTNALLIKRENERAKDRKRRKVYRDRRRSERDGLKLQVSKLSEILCRVQQGREQKPSLSSIAWKAVAKRQIEALKAAQAQQQALKTAVETRFQLIQEFGGVLNELCREEAPDEIPNGRKPVKIEPSDTGIFNAFLQEIDAVYVQTKGVFQEANVDSSSSWAFDTSTGGFGFTGRLDLAFDFKLASQRMWQRAHTFNCQEARVFYHLNDPSDTVALKFRISRRLSCGQSVSVVQCMVGRRYKEKNRLVVVWRSFTEGEGLFDGIHSDETGWCIAEPSTAKDGTSLNIRIRHKPIHFGSSQVKESVMEKFSRLLSTTGSEDFVEIVSSLDQFILTS